MKFMYSAVPGALTAYDINDLAISLVPRKLLIAGATDGNGEHTDIEGISQDIDVIRQAYIQSNASTQLDIKSSELIEKCDYLFKAWIK